MPFALNDREYRKFRDGQHGDLVAITTDSGYDIASPTAGFSVAFVDKVAPITYISQENDAAAWLVMKIDQTSGIVITYATVKNNPTVTDVTTARTNRATLTYNLPNIAF